VVSSSSLDALETSPDAPLCEEPSLSPTAFDTGCQRKYHKRDSWRRSKIVDSLHFVGGAEERRMATTIAGCGRFPIVALTEEGRVYVRTMMCHHRLCPTCGRHRAKQVAVAITEAIKRMNAPRFLTLTLKSEDRLLGDSLKYLADSFRRLRESRVWRDRVRGGIYAVEVTYNAKSGMWHAHLHCIFDGEFFPQKMLSDAWKEASRGSYIVDVRAVHDRATAAAYVAKYVGKPAQPEAWPTHKICEYATETKGRRLWHTFGTLHNARLSKPEGEEARDAGKALLGACRLVAAARRGSVPAERARNLIAKISWAAATAMEVHVETPETFFRSLDAEEVLEVASTCSLLNVTYDARDAAIVKRAHDRDARRLRTHNSPRLWSP
jgi:hypothetical protein